MKTILPKFFLLVGAAVVLLGCGQKKGADCAEGAERCPCYGNNTCDVGLVCLSELCVASFGAGGAGVPGTGGSPVTGTGGSPVTGTGGSPLTGTGGSPVTGTGGRTGTGGSSPAGTGGSSAPTAGNLIKNGNFSQGKTYWDLTWQAGQIASQSYTGGQYCIRNESGEFYLSFSLGYPPTPSDAFPLEAGATYTLSYRASGFGMVTMKIGQAVDPYDEIESFADSIASPLTLQAKQHMFTATTSEASAGLVFNGTLFYYETVCFDDVVVAKL